MADDTGGGSRRRAAPGAVTAAASERHHFRRMIAIWVVLSAIADPLFYFLAGPHIPPGTMTSTATGQQFDFNVLFIIAVPSCCAVWVYTAYALVSWRASRGGPEPVAGPYSRGHLGVQVGWIGHHGASCWGSSSSAPTSCCAGRGRRRRGAQPGVDTASHNILPIQVIAQQWKFTYRYPTYGGVRDPDLVMPADTTIAFHVTSLDVIHSFWAYQLGVKADANPGLDNVAFTKTTNQLGTSRCAARSCAASGTGRCSTTAEWRPSRATSWRGRATCNEGRRSAATKLLPPFAGPTSPTPTAPTAATTPTTATLQQRGDLRGAER